MIVLIMARVETIIKSNASVLIGFLLLHAPRPVNIGMVGAALQGSLPGPAPFTESGRSVWLNQGTEKRRVARSSPLMKSVMIFSPVPIFSHLMVDPNPLLISPHPSAVSIRGDPCGTT